MFESRISRLSTEERTDEFLMVQLCQGRDNALAELVHRYEKDVFRFCRHYLRETDSARDLAQETFLRVYTARSRFDSSRKFRPWLLCIARNLCLNELKRKKAVPMEALDEYASRSRDEHGDVWRYSGDGPDEQMMAEERRQRLAKALAGLNAESRELVSLRFFERLSAREIAEITGSTEGAVRTRLHRVLALLREKNSSDKDDV